MRPFHLILFMTFFGLFACSPMLPGTADAMPHSDQAPDIDQAADVPDEIPDDSVAEADVPVIDEESDTLPDIEYIALERTTIQWGTPQDDYIAAMTVDGTGTIYVAGSTYGVFPDCMNAGQSDMFISRVAPDLSLSWTRELGTAGYDYGYALYVTDGGLAYAGGITWGAFEGFENAGQYDRYLAAWQPDGTPAWVRQWGAEGADDLYGMQGDGKGDMWLLEYNAVARHAADGTEIWSSGELMPDTGFSGITVAPDGTVILAGSSHYPATYDRLEHCVVLTLDAAGSWRWTAALNDGGEQCTASAVSPAGDIYVTGTIQESDILLLKLNAAGERQWLVRLKTPDEDRGSYLAFDREGDLYLLGSTERVPPDNPAAVESDLLLIKFTSDGAPLWMSQWGSEWDDGAAGMAFDPQGRLIVAGYTAKEIDGNVSAGGTDLFISAIIPPE